MAETLSALSILSFALAVFFLAVAVFLWFFFHIPSVIGDLSGRTAKKSIEKMRSANRRTGNKAYKTSGTNAARGKITVGIKEDSKKTDNLRRPETGLFEGSKAGHIDSKETDALDDTRDLPDPEATDFLAGESISSGGSVPREQKRKGGKNLIMKEEIMLVHTDEVID